MQPILGNIAALAVAIIFYTWRSFVQVREKKQRLLCERVAYMLWCSAEVAEEPAEALTADVA